MLSAETKAESEALIISDILRKRNSIIVILFICIYILKACLVKKTQLTEEAISNMMN